MTKVSERQRQEEETSFSSVLAYFLRDKDTNHHLRSWKLSQEKRPWVPGALQGIWGDVVGVRGAQGCIGSITYSCTLLTPWNLTASLRNCAFVPQKQISSGNHCLSFYAGQTPHQLHKLISNLSGTYLGVFCVSIHVLIHIITVGWRLYYMSFRGCEKSKLCLLIKRILHDNHLIYSELPEIAVRFT